MRTFARRDLVAAFLALLFALIVTSHSRRIGDGGEYVDMAEAIARFAAPMPYAHFWFYPALAVPFVWIVRLIGWTTYGAFTLLNTALIGTAFWIASAVLSAPPLLLLFVSPIVWWLDKPHTEVFTFSLLTIAFVAMRPGHRDAQHEAGGSPIHSGWAVACLGAAGSQNPPIAALAIIVMFLLVITGNASLRDRRFVLLSLAGLLVAGLHPLYYGFRGGQLFPLQASTHGSVPNIDELTAVIRDTNIGLIANAPALALALAGAAALALTRPVQLIGADTAASLCAFVMFVASFAQTTNFNSGGTPGMSRYALWLIPLSIPFLRRADRVSLPEFARQAIGWLITASVVWSLAMFHPRWPENNGSPTWLARWLWSNHPSLDRPIPEVFIERLGGGDVNWWLPMTTPQCEKILLPGRGLDVPVWPVPCPPTPVPADCAAVGALCYANRQGTRYTFSHVPAPSFWGFRFDEDGVWSAEESRTIGALLQREKWWEMRVCSGEVVRAMVGMQHQRNYCAADRLLVYIKNSRPGAALRIRLPAPMTGAFVDGISGQELEKVTYGGVAGDLWDIVVPAPRASLVLILSK